MQFNFGFGVYSVGLLLTSVYGKLSFSSYDPFPLNGYKNSECQIDGIEGVCMFSWECQYIGGVSLGICKEGILFGACCASPPIIDPSSSFLTLSGGQLFFIRKREEKWECGKSAEISGEFESRIVNGVDAKVGEFPWQASLHLVTPFPVTLAWCGAVVLSSQWVITAAHCTQKVRARDLVVRYGSHSIYSNLNPIPTEERQAEEIFIHPAFTKLSKGHDIALIRMSEPVQFNEFILPICLPGSGVGSLLGVQAIVSGWGIGTEEGVLPTFLQKAVVPILNNEECEEMYLKEGKRLGLGHHFICAGYKEGGTDSCQGDSGGPLQILGKDNRWFLAGVTSSGFMCAKPNLPGLYTRISLYIPWILEHIAS